MEAIKAIVYGVGVTGKLFPKLMVEKGVHVVGAVGHVANIGKDLGEVAGLGYPLNVKISNDADTVLREHKADIVVVAVATDMESMYPHLKKCLENDLNVITTAEGAFYPWRTSPVIATKLDNLAKEHGVTLTGSGCQDGFLCNFATLLTGASHTIESVLVKVKYSIYSPELAKYQHVGSTREKVDTWLKEHGPGSSDFKIIDSGVLHPLEALIADLALTVSRMEQTIEPIIDDVDIEAREIGQLVKRGQVTGMREIDEIETEQGIKFRGEVTGKVFRPDEVESSEWYVKGVPELYLKNDPFPIYIATATQIVNRIPDVINAEPGFITVEKLPKLKYRVCPLHFYLNQR